MKTVLVIESDPLWSDIYETCLPKGARTLRIDHAARANGGFRYFAKTAASESGEEVLVKMQDVAAVVMNFACAVEAPETATSLIYEWRRSGYTRPIFIATSCEGNECYKKLIDAGVRDNIVVVRKDGFAPTILTPLLRRALQD